MASLGLGYFRWILNTGSTGWYQWHFAPDLASYCWHCRTANLLCAVTTAMDAAKRRVETEAQVAIMVRPQPCPVRHWGLLCWCTLSLLFAHHQCPLVQCVGCGAVSEHPGRWPPWVPPWTRNLPRAAGAITLSFPANQTAKLSLLSKYAHAVLRTLWDSICIHKSKNCQSVWVTHCSTLRRTVVMSILTGFQSPHPVILSHMSTSFYTGDTHTSAFSISTVF